MAGPPPSPTFGVLILIGLHRPGVASRNAIFLLATVLLRARVAGTRLIARAIAAIAALALEPIIAALPALAALATVPASACLRSSRSDCHQ